MKKPKLSSFLKPKTILFVLPVLVLVGIAGGSFFMYFQAKQEIAQLSTPEGQQRVAEQEVSKVIEQVSKSMILPENENPTLATVTDAEAIKKDQPFFEKAQNGDKVLVYVGAKKAIIYRPSEDLIVNVGFIAVDGDTNQGQVAGETSVGEKLTVEVRNGTGTAGLAQQVADTLKDSYTVQKTGDARQKNRTETVVVDLAPTGDEPTKNLAQTLDAEIVTELPEGEPASDANAVVLAGTDQEE